MRTLPLLALLVSLAPAWAEESDELAIYPGFARSELPESVRATLRAATLCAAERHEAPEPEPAVAPHVGAELVDGVPVALREARVEVDCSADPVRSCTYAYAWQEQTQELAYASVQCFGSHGDPYTSYLVSATRDVRKARRKNVQGTRRDRAIRLLSVAFHTTDFPGTQLSAFAAVRRRDGAVTSPSAVRRFDDYRLTDPDPDPDPEDSEPTLGVRRLDELVRATVAVACRAVGQCDVSPEPTVPALAASAPVTAAR